MSVTLAAELAALLGSSFLVGLSGALVPGPLLTLAIAESARAGFMRGPAVVLGHAIVELAAMAGLLFGVSQLVAGGGAQAAIGIVGGLALVWMGCGTGRGALRGDLELPAAISGRRSRAVADRRTAAARTPSLASLWSSPVLRGGVVSLGNPYWLLWWATVGAAYVSRSLAFGAAGLVAFYVGHILSDLGWISLVSLVVSSGRQALSQRAYRGIMAFCAGALVLLGGSFLWSGLAPLLASIRSAA